MWHWWDKYDKWIVLGRNISILLSFFPTVDIANGRGYLTTTKDNIMCIATIPFVFIANEDRVNVCQKLIE